MAFSVLLKIDNKLYLRLIDLICSAAWKFFIDEASPNAQFEDKDNFVSRSKGFFVPSVTAAYIFILEGNDHAQLMFNPNGDDPASVVSSKSKYVELFYVYFSYHAWLNASV